MAGANIVIRGGGGTDILNAAGLGNTYNSLDIQGEAGDDTITGGGKADPLAGGDGDDRVVGSPGADTMSGGNGNDVLVWNNGDGSDAMDGDAGNDEIEVNGSANAGDEFVITPGAGGRTTFDRVNLVPFTLDTLAERMTVSGLGGDDVISGAAGLAGRILLTLNGNTGLDTITGGDGADRISGGEAADVLDGAAGDDQVTGDRGGDQMRGGAGDDVLEWNDGDGSDVATGGDGADLTRVNGSVTAGRRLRGSPRTERASASSGPTSVPFTIDLDTERIEMNSLAGDDTIAVKAGLAGRLGVLADGGSGNDRIEVRNRAADSPCSAAAAPTAPSSTWPTPPPTSSRSTGRRARARSSPRKVQGRRARRQHRGDAARSAAPPAPSADCTGVPAPEQRQGVRIAGIKCGSTWAAGSFRVAPGEKAKVKVRLPRGGRAAGQATASSRVRAVVVLEARAASCSRARAT